MNEKETPIIIDIDSEIEQTPSRRERLRLFLRETKDTAVRYAPLALVTTGLAVANGYLQGYVARNTAGDIVDALGEDYKYLTDEDGVPAVYLRSDIIGDEGGTLSIHIDPLTQDEEEEE